MSEGRTRGRRGGLRRGRRDETRGPVKEGLPVVDPALEAEAGGVAPPAELAGDEGAPTAEGDDTHVDLNSLYRMNNMQLAAAGRRLGVENAAGMVTRGGKSSQCLVRSPSS